MVLEGLPRHTSTHAAGVVISPLPMVEYLPLARGPKGEVLTQYDMKFTEKTGLIKFDFLGLKTLTVIARALQLIENTIGTRLDIATIPLDDVKTYDLLCRGDALGVFQLESSGMRELLIKMKPEVFTDLIALVALYRPGPLESGMVDDFVDTKHGHKVASYPLPQLEPILQETYGVIVYQEQVMKIANVLASYSLGDADMLRRAMGKKIPEVMAAEKDKFMQGAEKNKVPLDKAEYIFDLMAKFAGYGFNKSHSAAYAFISYQTAYLKAHYPAQFMAALLSCDMNNTDKVVLYINECKDHGIEVLPPDINESFKDFTVIDERIRFGLAAVKNVGESALDSIIEERSKDGPYASLGGFLRPHRFPPGEPPGHREPDQGRHLRFFRRQALTALRHPRPGPGAGPGRPARPAERPDQPVLHRAGAAASRPPASRCRISPNGTTSRSWPTKRRPSVFISPAIRWTTIGKQSRRSPMPTPWNWRNSAIARRCESGG